MKVINQFINGKEHISKSERFGDVFNPANGEKTKKVSFANSEDVKLAIECAVEAGKRWAATPPLTRSRVFFRFKNLILRDMDKLALKLISLDKIFFVS